MDQIRTALYFNPPADGALTRAAARWLGRDAFGGVPDDLRLDALDPLTWAELTAAPRRYGFHATLKAPFALAEGRSLADLDAALRSWCAETPQLEIPTLELARLGSFFALVPGAASEPLQRFAGDVVRDFEPFRAPYDEAELARRCAGLTPQLKRNLRDWGYPYVFDEFRFHMTLTGPVASADRDRIEAVLRRQFAAFLGQPVLLDAVALFVEPRPGGDFTVHSRHALCQTVAKAP